MARQDFRRHGARPGGMMALARPPPPRCRHPVQRMTWDRVAVVEQTLDRYLAGANAAPQLQPGDPLASGSSLTAGAAVALFEDQLASRQLDVAARELKKTNRSYYTISSAGHENNAVLGAQLRLDDPA